MFSWEDLLAALAVVVNGLPQGLLALSFGFAALPTAIGFAIGALGALFFSSVAPISFQAESIVLAGTIGQDRRERCSIVFYTGLTMAVIGGLGLLEPAVAFVGPAVENGMMAGGGGVPAGEGAKPRGWEEKKPPPPHPSPPKGPPKYPPPPPQPSAY